MPLPENPKVLKLSDDLVETMRATFGTPKNYRPVHAKGQLVKGTFTPHEDASKLSKAQIFSQPSTPLIMRFSTDTGLKDLPDNGDNASRGLGMRFILSGDGHKHYDVIYNNAYGFIVSTGEGFLEQFKAMQSGKMEEWVENNPHAKYFQANQAPAHAYSFATEQWHATHAFKFTNAEGKETFFRWRLVPWQGVMKYSKEDAKKQGKNYQFEDLAWRLENNKPFKYRLLAQLAEEGDEINDSTKTWPETNEIVEMGEVVVEKLWAMDEGAQHGHEQKRIIYDPVPRYIDGIDASDDPLFEVRTAVYLISGRIRREHVEEDVQQAVK
ncbi:heme-dependent catalase [Massarina eburnea CBS 473.64]|uniref:Heme-dependent catalase n=1 Tax=Massarina eburnea CBS 473.64 TaxID=1395130 RepID=A0A6A6SF53_9PLEO|nr:heme-dependent catalase [Massarina eburnea CBS 473.64]